MATTPQEPYTPFGTPPTTTPQGPLTPFGKPPTPVGQQPLTPPTTPLTPPTPPAPQYPVFVGPSSGAAPPSTPPPTYGTPQYGTTPAQSAQQFGGPSSVTGPNGQPVPPAQQATVQTGQGTVDPTTGKVSGSSFNGSSYYGKTDSASVSAYVTGMLAGTGREGDAQMWENYINSKGGGPNAYWDNLITTNTGGDAKSNGGGGGGSYTPGQGVPGQGTVFGANNPLTAQQTALEQQMVNNLSLAENPVTANDPVIKAQTDAFNAQQQQAARNYQTTAAEQGGPSANLSAVARSQAEQVGQNTSGMEATLMGNEVNARRSEIQNLLSQQSGLLTNEQSMQLQEELAQLNLANNAINTNNNTLNQSGNPTSA